ncbi:MAG: glycosyltransferase family 9 protein [candidate division Zixibacteria bacterium]|nr:glycosyltransferase family 9 protein [candidate division Zixibacteria bacterium]
MKRILLSRTDAIGDLILTLPVARSIKEAYPDYHITMLVSEYTEQLLEGEEYIDGVMTIPGRELGSYVEVRELSHLLKAGDFDAVAFFYPRFSLALAARMARISRRIGTGYRSYSLLLNERVKLHRKHSGKHELDLNYELVESAFPGLPRHEPHLAVLEQEICSAQALLTKHGVNFGGPYVIVHPFSRGSAPNWKLENYVSLVQGLAASSVTVLITGSQQERQRLGSFFTGSLGGVVNVAGETDLRQLKGLIKATAMVVTSSTGPIHIATAVGTFAVGIYPPVAALSPVRWGPRGGANKLFVPEVTPNEGQTGSSMDGIKVENVLAFILSKLQADIRLRKQ